MSLFGGEEIEDFESTISEYVGGHSTVAVSSGTAALHLALLVSGVGPGDDVIMPALTYVAPANAVRHAGGHPVFVDSEGEFGQLDVLRAEAFVERNYVVRSGVWRRRDRTRRRLAAILAVDLLGHPCDLDAVLALGDRLGVAVIDDAAEAFGASVRGRRVGGIARVSALSFNANKIMTTSGGGMVVCHDADLADRARALASHSRTDDTRYLHDRVGFNYMMPTMHAALGLQQFERIGSFLERKRRVAAQYSRALGKRGDVNIPREAEWARASWWLYAIHVDAARRKGVIEALAADNIQARPLFDPMHRVGAHAAELADACPEAERLSACGLCLPCSTSITDNEVEFVIDRLGKALDAA